MPVYKIPPQLKLPDTRFESIRNGTRAIVFKIFDPSLCKFPLAGKVLYKGNCFNDTENYEIRSDKQAMDLLEYEAIIAGYLHDNEIAVPKPVATAEIELLVGGGTKFPVYIMEYLPFKSGAELGYHELIVAERLAKEQMFKAADHGFTPGSDWRNPNNFMYDEKNKKTYLIDFEFWEYDEKNLFHSRVPDFSL